MHARHRVLSTLTRLATLPLAAATALAAGGCGDEHHHDHGAAERVEIETRGLPPTTLAVWTDDDGWTDENGEPLEELPPPVHAESGVLLPLRAGDPRASLTLRFFDHDGSELEAGTVSRDEATGERACTEYSVRYYPRDEETDIIAWPPIQHPDSSDGSFQFVELASGEITGIFHCDHVHIYPTSEGTVDVEVVLWHGDHADEIVPPITLRVEAAD